MNFSSSPAAKLPTLVFFEFSDDVSDTSCGVGGAVEPEHCDGDGEPPGSASQTSTSSFGSVLMESPGEV